MFHLKILGIWQRVPIVILCTLCRMIDVDESLGESWTFYLLNVVCPCREYVLLSAVVMAATMTVGNVPYFTSIALPQMELNQDEASWYLSLPSLASPLGTLFNALTLDAYGPRFNILFATISNTIGWFLVADKHASCTQMYLGRVFGGFGLGACVLPSIVYVAESITVNNVRLRSTIGTWVIFSSAIGNFLLYILSLILTYDGVAIVFAILSTASLISILIFIPESPAWLYEKGRVGDAEVAQLRLGVKQPSILRACDEVLPVNEKDNSTTTSFKPSLELSSYSLKNVVHYLSQIRRPDVYKPTIITIAFKFFRDFSGVLCISSNLVDVITVYPLESDAYVLSLISSVVQIVGCLLLTILMPLLGAKTVCIISFLGAFAGQLGLGFSILFENPSSSNIFNYVHILSVWEIMLASQLGLMAVSHSVLGEIFPVGAKGFATIPLFTNALFVSINMKIFPYVYPRYKNIVFFVYGVVCALGAVFIAAFLPETVGKTMEEIHGSFFVRLKSVEEVE